MRFIFLLFIAVFLFQNPSSSHAQPNRQAEENAANMGIDIPLVILRYNKRNINYKDQLYRAISKAVEVKPNIVIDIVSYIPKGKTKSRNQYLTKRAGNNLHKLVMNLTNMGIPRNSINISKEIDPSLKFNEIHLFIR